MKQREIKFRAWDGGKMRYGVLAGHGDYVAEHEDDSLWWWHEPPKAIMQFTSLHDKSGKDIYEGDIFDSGQKRGSDKSAILYEVHWEDQYAGWGFKQIGGFCLTGGIDKNNMTVIGNIHENPELLK